MSGRPDLPSCEPPLQESDRWAVMLKRRQSGGNGSEGEKQQTVGPGVDRLHPLHDVLEATTRTPVSRDALIKWQLFHGKESTS